MKNSSLLQGDVRLVEPLVTHELHLLEERPKAALGNMKAHLSLTNSANHWVSVGRADLQRILKYVSELEEKHTELLAVVENKSL